MRNLDARLHAKLITVKHLRSKDIDQTGSEHQALEHQDCFNFSKHV